MSLLGALEGYRLWAPTYADETAISQLEQALVAEATPPLAGLRLLDAGCGTGRRLRTVDAAAAVGVDLSAEMLAAGLGEGPFKPGVRTMVADLRRLPLPDRAFDVVWCRLAIGHLPEAGPAYAEIARVADAGALVIVSDFHPAAYAAGHRRTFRDRAGIVHEVEHHVHELSDHHAAARAASLAPVAVREARIGPEVRSFYEAAGRARLYEQHRGLPVVLVMTFRRGP